MGYRILWLLFFSCSGLFSQEIGSIQNGNHQIELHKTNNQFSCFYSDINSSTSSALKSFQFPNIEHVYSIIMDGFKNNKGHMTYVLTNNDTIVKFEFNKINGEVKLKIKHNNLIDNSIGTTTYLNQDQINTLFGIAL